MSKADRPVLLVGGVPGESAEEVFRTVGPILGDLAIGLTDGEIGLRRMWIFFVALNTWARHPDLEMVRPVIEGVPNMPDWVKASYTIFDYWTTHRERKGDYKKLDRILQQPQHAAADEETGIRTLRLHRFPYVIHYRIEGATIVIFAIMFGGRDPSSWRSRL